MSSDSNAKRPVPTLQPTSELAPGGVFSAGVGLHPRLRAHLDALGIGRTLSAAAALNALLPFISKQYEQVDEERRGVVRSMQMLAEEARSFTSGLVGGDAAQLRAILDHIKDVVITVTGEGAISVFNPTGERLFGHSQTELIGVSIVRLLPELPLQGSLLRGLQSFAAEFTAGGGRAEARLTQARRKDGSLFPVELVASQVHIDRRDMYVICLRDMSERLATEQALRDSESRYRTLVESAPEVIVVVDAHTGCCTDANESALQFFGIERAQIGALDLRNLLQAAEQTPAAPPRRPVSGCRAPSSGDIAAATGRS